MSGWYAGAGLGVVVGLVSCGPEHPPFVLDTPRANEATGGAPSGAAGEGRGASAGLPGDAAGAAGEAHGLGGTRGGLGPCTPALPTGFCFVSDSDDSIGDGRSINIAGDVTMRSYFASSVTGTAKDDEADWDFSFGPPDLEFFIPGDYVQKGYGEDAATLSISGDGSGCDHSGTFHVSEIEWGPWGDIVRFAATFTQQCDRFDAYLSGAINFNANGVPDAPPEDPRDCEVQTPTGFCFVAQGENRTFREDGGPASLGAKDATFNAWAVREGAIQLHVSSPDTLTSYLIELGRDDGLPIAPGHYEGLKTSAAAPDQLWFRGACNGVVADVDILALEQTYSGGPNGVGEVSRADLDLQYRCEHSAAEAYVKFRYQAP